MPQTVDQVIKQLAHHGGDVIVKRYDDGVWKDLDEEAVCVVEKGTEYIEENGEFQLADKPFVGIW